MRRPVAAWRHAAIEAQDGILASYPRSGSRWLEQMLGELLVGREIDFWTTPYPIPFVSEIRGHRDAPRLLSNDGRLIKTHDRYRSEYRRAIYIVRHPGDVAISYYRHVSRWTLPRMPFERWFKAWIRGQIDPYGTWQENVESWLDAPVQVELIRFEDLKRSPAEVLERTLRALDVNRDPDAIRRAVERNSLERMMAKLEHAERGLAIANLPRPPEAIQAARGRSAVWREWLTGEQVALLERHAGRAMERCGYDFGEADDSQFHDSSARSG